MKRYAIALLAAGALCVVAGDPLVKVPANLVRPPPIAGVDEMSFNAGVMTACLIIRDKGVVPQGRDELSAVIKDSWQWWTNEFNRVLKK